MKNQTVAEKLDGLLRLQKIDSSLDSIKKLRGDLPEEVRNIEDSIEGLKKRLEVLRTEQEELISSIEQAKEGIKAAKELVKKYEKQQKNVKNSREYNAITKELDLQELEVQVSERKILEGEEKLARKKEDLGSAEQLLSSKVEELEAKKEGLKKLLDESESEEKSLLAEREEAVKDIEKKLLDYYHRLRSTLSNGLAVVPVVRGAALGGNIVIPPQKIAEIRERKRIVIDEHSGRILAYVETESLTIEKKVRTPEEPAPTRRGARLADAK